MKMAILGYGVEGRAVQKYFQTHPFENPGRNLVVPAAEIEITVFDKFTDETLPDLSEFEVVFRSPSVYPHSNWTSSTQYFFSLINRKHIIGITGTKGKGTTCSMTTALLRKLGFSTFLVGNIGTPAIEMIDQIRAEKADDFFVVYEMSSFQLWDLRKSPHIAAILQISPDHLDVHKDFDEYVMAKGNIARHQTPEDTCVFYANNPDSERLARLSQGRRVAYPATEGRRAIDELLDELRVPGEHNRENAEAALEITAAALEMSLDEMAMKYHGQLAEALRDFKSLPHRIQFIRELNGVDYYDDNYSSALPAAEVAIKAFSDRPVVLIAGGKDRHLDFSNHQKVFFGSPNVKKVILIGETKQKIAAGISPEKYLWADTLEEALKAARAEAENYAAGEQHPVVLMSPGAPSFDMFKNFNERGEQFQKLVEEFRDAEV